jgi:pimeloyl-ACP methyl ester carboxylesterase
VRAIIVIDSFVKPFPFDRAGLERRTQAIRTDKRRALTAWFGHLAHDPAQTEQVVAGAMSVDAEVLTRYLTEAARSDARPVLEGRPVRVHLQASRILAGEPARSDAQILAAAGMDRLTGATVTVFRDAAHWIFLDQRNACLADLRRVIDGPAAR